MLYCAGMRIVAVALVIEAQPLDAIGDKNHK